MKLSDAHAHLNEINKGSEYLANDYSLIFTCSSKQENWKYFKSESNEKKIIPFFGTHPWFIDTYEGIEPLIEILRKYRCAGVGEIGLDSNHDLLEKQITVFQEQISVAEEMKRTAEIHMIRSEEMILKILKKKDVPCILHSFTGPLSYIKPFTETGCYFSISPRILTKSIDKISSIIKNIPEDRLLIETDAPNNRASIHELISLLSKIINVDEEILTELTYQNLCKLIP